MLEGSVETDQTPFVRLDFGDHSLSYTHPIELIQTRDPSQVRHCLEQLRGREAVGFISYEAGHALEPKLMPIARKAASSEPPLLWFGVFEQAHPAPPLPSGEAAWLGEPRPAISFEDYAAQVEEIRSNILDGDLYQLNLTFPCAVPVAGHPLSLYAQLLARAEGPWSALVFTGAHWLISCSPELFFTSKEGRITCRPMKGTAPPDSEPDLLFNDAKNRAENLMIVDLVRNDLSRVAKAGTVKVPELFSIERYPTILQMTSTVVADMEPGLDAVDVLEAIFPCGSITGAPKIRAMERIAELEHGAPRGPYTGSIGRIGKNGDSEFNVAIRTLVLGADGKSARYNVGSAIVIDSDPASEWQECLQKTAFLASPKDLQLLETFALGRAANPLLALHLERLERSARDLGFAFDLAALEAELGRRRDCLEVTVRCRIALEKSGTFHLECSPLPASIDDKVTVSIFQRQNAPDDFRLAYKTSDRRFYDEVRKEAGTFEVLFTDKDGFLTEGSFTNLFVNGGDHLLTPPLRRGLLPGVLRRHLIDQGMAIEQDLRPGDLAAGFWIGNSLRGLVPAALEPGFTTN